MTKAARWLLLSGAMLAVAPSMAAPSNPYPTYTVGPQADGSIVLSTNQTITPAGRLVDLGSPVRAKAVALDPDPASHTGAVLQISGKASVQIFDLVTGKVLQSFSPAGDVTGSYGGIAYTADGRHLLFSQKSSHLAVATVDEATGLLGEAAQVALPPDASINLFHGSTAYPGGVAVSADGTNAAVLLNQNNTVGVVDLMRSPPVLTRQIRVGNVPNSIVVSGALAYVSNEGGRVAASGDFTDISSGTPIVSDPATDSASTGTVSIVDLRAGKVIGTIAVGLHPTGMALSGSQLLVANAYGDSISVIDLNTRLVVRTIPVAVPLPGAYGVTPCGIAVHAGRAYVTLYTANAIAVIDIAGGTMLGTIPTASTPSTIAYDAARDQLVVSNDKGVGTRGAPLSLYGRTGFNSHQDTGTVELVPIPNTALLAADTAQVAQNNHWDLLRNARVGPHYVNAKAVPVAIPAHIGEPSLIKHLFLIIKENRTYDQLFGDIATANGDASLAVFAAATPNQHALVRQFALLDNVYAPSRQSADGHPWIVSAIAAYADDIQSPYWIRSYPGGNSNDEMVYTPRGFLWDAARARGLSVRMFGEWSGAQAIAGKHDWAEWFAYSQYLEGALPANPTTITPTTDTESATVPSVAAILDPHYPSFNTGIPDQYRADYWLAIFNRYEATRTLPALTILWLPDDHTSGYTPGFPIPAAAQADNDLALGRIVEAITHGADWPTTAVFVEEDDAQNGVDHVDGHRQPVQIISPYAVHSRGTPDHTTYTAESIDRTIEQILGLTPMTQFDLVASPMTTAFTDTPDLAVFDHLPPTLKLDSFPLAKPAKGASNDGPAALRFAWEAASAALFRDRTGKADAVDETTLSHLVWYASTGFIRPYPGEADVRMPSAFSAGKDD